MSLPLAICTFPGGVVSHIGMSPPPKGMVCAPFWSKNGYRLCPFWSGIEYSFRGNYGMYEAIKLEAFIKTGFIWTVSSRKTEGFERCFTFLPGEACPYRLY